MWADVLNHTARQQNHLVMQKNAKAKRQQNVAVIKNSPAAARKTSSRRALRSLTTGSHCSGLLTEAQALEQLSVPHEIVVACDSDAKVKQVIEQSFTVGIFFDDMMATPVGHMPGKLGLYVCGFPCQPYSPAGRKRGLEDNRALPLDRVLEYISRNAPRSFILENVAALATDKKYKWLFDKIIQSLGNLNQYAIHWKVVNTMDYGIPQDRRRIYIVGIQRDVLQQPFQWPRPIQSQPLSAF